MGANVESMSQAKSNQRRSIRKSLGERIFTYLNYTFFIVLGILTLFPFLHIVAKSLSGEAAVISGSVTIFPIDLQFGTYKWVLGNQQFLNSLYITVLITVIGTVLGLLVTVLCAYPLSKPGLVARKPLLLIFIFTMVFNGGLIPTYMLMNQLGLVNTVGSLFLPGLVNVFNMLIVKNYFESLPDGLEESAKLDGASNVRILFSVMIPLSMPVLATVGLFYAVMLWNSYFNALIYITTPALKPLQLYLKELIASTEEILKIAGTVDVSNLSQTPETVRAASIITATIPIICVYPFLQKHFVKGVLVGSVKG